MIRNLVGFSDRLQTIANIITKGESVADVGTDHGYIPIYLYVEGISPKIIATDVNVGPIEIARNNIQSVIPDNTIETRIGNGLEVIGIGEVDTIVIAGMGGLLITDILAKDIKKSLSYKKFILQPRNAQDKLRMWLVKNGFKIFDEYLVREGKYICEIIVACPGEDKVDKDIYYEIGYKLIEKKDPLLETFIHRKIQAEIHILNNTEKMQTDKAKRQHIWSLKRIEALKEVLNHVR